MNHPAKLYFLHEIRLQEGKNKQVYPHVNEAMDGKGYAQHCILL